MDSIDAILKPIQSREQTEKEKLENMVLQGRQLTVEQMNRLKQLLDDSRQTTAQLK